MYVYACPPPPFYPSPKNQSSSFASTFSVASSTSSTSSAFFFSTWALISILISRLSSDRLGLVWETGYATTPPLTSSSL